MNSTIIITDAKGQQHEVIAAKPISSDPRDYYLLAVIHMTGNINTPIVVHKMNTIYGGFHDGHYCENLAEALAVFASYGGN